MRWGSDTGDGLGAQELETALVDMLAQRRDRRDPALAMREVRGGRSASIASIEADAALAADRMVALQQVLAGHSAACERAVRMGSKTMDAEDAHRRTRSAWLCHTVDEHVRRKAAEGYASAIKGMQLVSSLLPAPHENQKTCASVDTVLHIGAASSCPAAVPASCDLLGADEFRCEQMQWSRFFLKLRAGADEFLIPCVMLQSGLSSPAQRANAALRVFAETVHCPHHSWGIRPFVSACVCACGVRLQIINARHHCLFASCIWEARTLGCRSRARCRGLRRAWRVWCVRC